MKVIYRPSTRTPLSRKWKVVVGLFAAFFCACILIAQQPVAQGPQAGTAAAWLFNLTQIGGSALALGQTTMSASVPVAIASNQSSVPVSFSPTTSSTGALSLYYNSSAVAGSIKASAGNLYVLDLSNAGTIECFLQLFNTAGTPTAGTSVIDSYGVQAGVSRTIAAGGFALENFATGIGYAGAIAASGSTTTGCTTTFAISAHYQ